MESNTRILIIGGGAFGTSTAYHLSLRGYRSITVLDRYPVPSYDAAANDISKVIRSDYSDPIYASMGIESIKAWKEWNIFEGLYHEPGWILSAKDLSVPFVENSVGVSRKLGVKGVERLSPDQIRQRIPIIKGDLDGWNCNVWNPTAGWAHADIALERMAFAAQERGVSYITGDRGHVQRLVHDAGICEGAVTKDGTIHRADLVVVAAGAWSGSLVDVEGQLTAKGHSVAHIQMTSSEIEYYQSMPILDNLELGYFFPPQADGTFKMAHSQFLINTKSDLRTGITTSVPHTFVQSPMDDLPLAVEATMRQNLARVFPELSRRPFSYTRICWDADTADRHFLVTKHPRYKGLVLATGGSAHGFKFLPVLGKYIADSLEGKLDAEKSYAWRWKAGEAVETKNLAHMDPDTELSSLSGWRNRRRQGARLARL